MNSRERWGARLFLVGLAIVVSPVLTGRFLAPIIVFLTMIIGMVCMGFGLLFSLR